MVQETSENRRAVALLDVPIIEKGMYLTDGTRLYYVCDIKKDLVYLENCFTLCTHTRNLNEISRWREVKTNKRLLRT